MTGICQIIISQKPFMLAGGITAKNEKLAISYNSWAIDVLSGVRTNDKLGENKIRRLVNMLGQVLLVKKMKKRKIVAETGAGQHAMATATPAVLKYWASR